MTDTKEIYNEISVLRDNMNVWTDDFENKVKKLIVDWAVANNRYVNPMFLGGYETDPYYLARVEIANTLHTLSIWDRDVMQELFEYKLLNFWTKPIQEIEIHKNIFKKINEIRDILRAGE